jgi:hypothetical protein
MVMPERVAMQLGNCDFEPHDSSLSDGKENSRIKPWAVIQLIMRAQ